MSKGYLCDEPPTISAIHCLPLARHWFLHSYSHLSDDKSTYLVVSFMPTFNAVRIETRQAIDEFLSRRWYGNITQQRSADLLKSVQQLRHYLVHQSTSIPDSALVNSLAKLKNKLLNPRAERTVAISPFDRYF
ncbi:hypothetical protein FRC02_001240 [Tulasnella sp. 418]|nr:hypothetical protein FRC02_001240 [Tulasnella sp. 418]